jgi:hypothetical protein
MVTPFAYLSARCAEFAVQTLPVAYIGSLYTTDVSIEVKNTLAGRKTVNDQSINLNQSINKF